MHGMIFLNGQVNLIKGGGMNARAMTPEEATVWLVADPTSWSKWPYLPVKRGDYFNDPNSMGVLYNPIKKTLPVEAVRPVVIICNLFMLPKTYKEFLELPRFSYNSVETMMEDGWIVD